MNRQISTHHDRCLIRLNKEFLSIRAADKTIAQGIPSIVAVQDSTANDVATSVLVL